jgi:hypothetical protein
MKKSLIVIGLACLLSVHVTAQDEEEKGGFKKENLFTGGSISLAFSDNAFLIGGSPVFGYSISKWLDGGLVFNYTYNAYRDVAYYQDKLHQSIYGAGAFVKIYPIRFLFLQAQYEHNFIHQKYFPPPNGGQTQTDQVDANSFLVGGGYTSSRYPGSGQPFYYFAILFDIADTFYSPYTDAAGRAIPIIRAGVQIPLFQKKG